MQIASKMGFQEQQQQNTPSSWRKDKPMKKAGIWFLAWCNLQP
jgi:hypothetical protein